MPARQMKVCRKFRRFCLKILSPWQRPFIDGKVIYQIIYPYHTPTNNENMVKIGP